MQNEKSIFLLLNQIRCFGYSKEPSNWVGSFEHPNMLMVEKKNNHNFMLKKGRLFGPLWFSDENRYSRTSMAWTDLGPWKIGSSTHLGWIMHKMNCRDHDDSSSQPSWMSHQSSSHWTWQPDGAEWKGVSSWNMVTAACLLTIQSKNC